MSRMSQLNADLVAASGLQQDLQEAYAAGGCQDFGAQDRLLRFGM